MIILKDKLSLLRYLKMNHYKDLSYRLIFFLNKHITCPQDIENTHPFFASLYDEIYHEVIFKKIHIQKNILRIFEFLALPLDTSTLQQRKNIYQRILMIKEETLKKKHRLREKIIEN